MFWNRAAYSVMARLRWGWKNEFLVIFSFLALSILIVEFLWGIDISYFWKLWREHPVSEQQSVFLRYELRPGLDQGRSGARHFYSKFSHKSGFVRCPCAFRLRRLAHCLPRGVVVILGRGIFPVNSSIKALLWDVHVYFDYDTKDCCCASGINPLSLWRVSISSDTLRVIHQPHAIWGLLCFFFVFAPQSLSGRIKVPVLRLRVTSAVCSGVDSAYIDLLQGDINLSKCKVHTSPCPTQKTIRAGMGEGSSMGHAANKDNNSSLSAPAAQTWLGWAQNAQ